MSRLLLVFVFFIFASHSFVFTVSAQKSLPLDQQSQEVQRTGDQVQIGMQGQDDTSPTNELASANQDTISTTRSASLSGIANTPPQGFASSLTQYINWLLSAVMVIVLLLAFFQFITAGFEWITSGGDSSKTESARQRIINAFVGVLIVSAAYAVTQFVAYILGFESINDALTNVRRINVENS
ncbi:MAG: pilin [Patescibacteria group bacterium]